MDNGKDKQYDDPHGSLDQSSDQLFTLNQLVRDKFNNKLISNMADVAS